MGRTTRVSPPVSRTSSRIPAPSRAAPRPATPILTPVDDEERGRAYPPPFGAWWMDPTRLLPPGVPVPPVAALESLLRAAGRRLAGRHLTGPGTGGALRLRLTALRLDPEPVGLAIGQIGEVTVEATEV